MRVIAVVKFLKALLLTGLSLGLFRSINHDLGETMRTFAVHFRIDPESRIFRAVLVRVANVDPRTLRTYGLITLLFAAELCVEGVGLWLDQAWAKYMVVIATAVFIPEEARACVTGFTWEKAVILVINAAVLIYVCRVLLHRKAPKA